MDLIKDFKIKPFSHIAWVSLEAKRSWEPALRRVANLIWRLEVESVAEGIRAASWQTIDEHQLISFSTKMLKLGLFATPVRYSKKFNGFAHFFEDAGQGEPRNISVVVAKKPLIAEEFIDAYHRGDHIKQGELLGFPGCCTRFFSQSWLQGFYDPIWQAAQNSKILISGKNYVRVQAHPFSNPILRYAGIRLSFHIPCSFSCEKTIIKGEELMLLARGMDKDTATLLEALLSMPSSWDVLHGVAVVRTPIFYIITSSIPTRERYVVEATGDFIPREAMPGAVYPFTEVKNG